MVFLINIWIMFYLQIIVRVCYINLQDLLQEVDEYKLVYIDQVVVIFVMIFFRYEGIFIIKDII